MTINLSVLCNLLEMPIKLKLSFEISSSCSTSIRTRLSGLYMRVRSVWKRDRLLCDGQYRPQSDAPLFWCSGIPDDFELWPGPPPYFPTSPLLPDEVLTVPLCELEDQASWIRQTCASGTAISENSGTVHGRKDSTGPGT